MRKGATSNNFSKFIYFTFLESAHAALHGGVICFEIRHTFAEL